jgi:DNA-binding transcriptional ArsR family regulator
MAHLDRIFHSLSDSTRRAVIAQLASGPTTIGDLSQRHLMGLPSFMKRIRELGVSEIVVSRKMGRVRMCQLRPDVLAAAQGGRAGTSRLGSPLGSLEFLC